jgi:hypothetical protein
MWTYLSPKCVISIGSQSDPFRKNYQTTLSTCSNAKNTFGQILNANVSGAVDAHPQSIGFQQPIDSNQSGRQKSCCQPHFRAPHKVQRGNSAQLWNEQLTLSLLLFLAQRIVLPAE